jgi:hypothetical protein
MKQLVTYMAFNQQFNELFDKGIEVKKITSRIKNFCPTGYVVSIEDISENKAKEYVDFHTTEAKYEENMSSQLNKMK